MSGVGEPRSHDALHRSIRTGRAVQKYSEDHGAVWTPNYRLRPCGTRRGSASSVPRWSSPGPTIDDIGWLRPYRDQGNSSARDSFDLGHHSNRIVAQLLKPPGVAV